MLTELHREGGGRPGNTLWGKGVAEGGNIMSPSRWGSSLVWLQRGRGSLWAGEAAEVEGAGCEGLRLSSEGIWAVTDADEKFHEAFKEMCFSKITLLQYRW